MSEQDYHFIEKVALDMARKNDDRLQLLLTVAAQTMTIAQFIRLTDQVIAILMQGWEEAREQTEKRARVTL